MLSHKELNRLNKVLGDHPNVGYAPDIYNLGGGERQPQYKWAWAPDLTYPAQCGTKQDRRYKSDLIMLPDFGTVAPVYHDVPLLDEPVWVLAKWFAPIGREAWKAMYGDELRYPEHGQYVVTDHALALGVQPNEPGTWEVIAAISQQRVKSLNDMLCLSRDRMSRVGTKHQNEIDAMVDDAILPLVPGKRGGPRSQPYQFPKESTA